MRWLLRAAVLLLAGSFLNLAGAAWGQANPIRMLDLTAEDLSLIETSANRLYEAGEIGALETWSNAQSGNSGSMRLLATFERDGLPCRRIEHVIKVKKDATPKRLVLATCRTGDGVWKLV